MEKEYRNIHDWIRRRLSHVKVCAFCGKSNSLLDNALKTGFKHDKNIDNYIKLCRKCHVNYDHPEGIKHSDETKKKIGEKSRERLLKNGVSEAFKKSNKGKKMTQKTKDKIRNTVLNQGHHRSKRVINIITGEIYSSCVEASVSSGIPYHKLYSNLSTNKKNKTNFNWHE